MDQFIQNFPERKPLAPHGNDYSGESMTNDEIKTLLWSLVDRGDLTLELFLPIPSDMAQPDNEAMALAFTLSSRGWVLHCAYPIISVSFGVDPGGTWFLHADIYGGDLGLISTNWQQNTDDGWTDLDGETGINFGSPALTGVPIGGYPTAYRIKVESDVTYYSSEIQVDIPRVQIAPTGVISGGSTTIDCQVSTDRGSILLGYQYAPRRTDWQWFRNDVPLDNDPIRVGMIGEIADEEGSLTDCSAVFPTDAEMGVYYVVFTMPNGVKVQSNNCEVTPE